jgi:hypothetical protein
MAESFESFIALTNKDAIIASLGGIEADVQNQVVKNLKDGGSRVKDALRDSLPDAWGVDAVSLPGGVPLSQTGELRSKIQATVLPLMLNEPVTLKIYVTMKGFYGRMLEFGTSKMAARPWFYDGIKRMFPFLAGNVETALAEVVARRNKKK